MTKATSKIKFSQSIVTKALSKGLVRAYLNTTKDNKMVSYMLYSKDTDAFEDIEEAHATAAMTLANRLGWVDTRRLRAARLNRLSKPNDSGDELVWIQEDSPCAIAFMQADENGVKRFQQGEDKA